jgi:hypothetical protein
VLIKFRKIYRSLKAHPQARIFMLNLWTHVRLGGVSGTALKRLLQLVQDRLPMAVNEVRELLVASPTFSFENLLSEAIWKELELIAVHPTHGFLLKPLENCADYQVGTDVNMYTVLEVRSFTNRYFTPQLFLEHCGFVSAHSRDHEVAERLLSRHLSRQTVAVGKMEKDWLKAAFLHLARTKKTAKTYRTRIPAFWVRPETTKLPEDATKLRNLLGLVHFGDGEALIEIQLSGKAFKNKSSITTTAVFVRPNALGCRPGKRFRAVTPAEAAVRGNTFPHPPWQSFGLTVDLERLAANHGSIDGAGELVAQEIPWATNDLSGLLTAEQQLAAAEEWWNDYNPEIRYLGRVDRSAEVRLSDGDDSGFFRRIANDLERSMPKVRIPKF